MGRSAAARSRPRPRSAPRARSRPRPVARAHAGGIRWDRVARTAFLLVLAVVVLLYAAPVQHWLEQRRTAAEHAAELRRLEAEHERLTRRAQELTRADAIEREARRLGMVKRGERAYVVEGLPAD
jgi:cell division protein FtsB